MQLEKEKATILARAYYRVVHLRVDTILAHAYYRVVVHLRVDTILARAYYRVVVHLRVDSSSQNCFGIRGNLSSELEN
jgi:hypothetical protein